MLQPKFSCFSFHPCQAVAQGTAHSAEGLSLEELSVKAGDAQLTLRGSLLGPRQDANLLITDFPAAILHPLYRALPALQVWLCN